MFRSIRYSRFLGPLFPFHQPSFAFFNYCETYTRRPHTQALALWPSCPPPPCPNPQVALTVFYRTPSLLYLYQSHWPWTPPISARHYATTTSTTSTTTSTTTTQNSDRSATPVKSQPKSLSKKRMVSPRESRRLTWRAKIFFFFSCVPTQTRDLSFLFFF